MTRTGVIGAMGGIELPSIKLTFAETRPQGRMLVSFTGSFDDVGAAKEAALTQVSAGADLLFHNADAAGLGCSRLRCNPTSMGSAQMEIRMLSPPITFWLAP